MKERIKHPVTAWKNWRADLALRVLATAIVLTEQPKVEHERLRASLGWSARRFDVVSDLAVDLGFVEYEMLPHSVGVPCPTRTAHYRLTHEGRMFFLNGRRK